MSWFIAGSCLLLVGWWLVRSVERPLVEIEAALDIVEQGLPVYAQFIVTQRITLPSTTLSKLKIPLYAPRGGERLTISLLSPGNQVIETWEYQTTLGSQVAELPIAFLESAGGDYAIQFAAPHFAPAEQLQAPRVFVESADANYPLGNYRIANNEKKGDVALTLFETVPRGQVWREHMRADPWLSLSRIFLGVAAGLAVSTLPYVLSSKPANGSGTGEAHDKRPPADSQR